MKIQIQIEHIWCIMFCSFYTHICLHALFCKTCISSQQLISHPKRTNATKTLGKYFMINSCTRTLQENLVTQVLFMIRSQADILYRCECTQDMLRMATVFKQCVQELCMWAYLFILSWFSLSSWLVSP